MSKESERRYISLCTNLGKCYAGETQITTVDGSAMYAKNIRIGMKLLCYGGKELTVDNIYQGEEKELFLLKTSKAQIKVSAGHPMLLECGTGITAQKLRIGNTLLFAGQTPAEITSIETVEYNDTVYNFSFAGEEEGNYLIANGFYSGDFYAQHILRGTPPPLTPEQEQLKLKLKELANRMK
jgi:hypothetical protein